jgi:hypothetical protein
MKNINKIFGGLLLAATIFSCGKPDNVIYGVTDNVKVGGGTLRTIAPIVSPTITLGSPVAAFITNVEVQDINNGDDTNRIDIYASFKDNSLANGTNPRPEILVKNVPNSAFTAGARGIKYANVSVSIDELKAKLNLTDAQYTGGDQFVIRLASVMNDGRVFSNTNGSAAVIGGAYYSSPFVYNANVVCPISESLAGTHTYVSTMMAKGPSAAGVPCGGTLTGSVTWGNTATPGAYTTTDMSFGMTSGPCWGDPLATSAGARMTWFCKSIVASGVDTFGDSYTYTMVSATATTLTIDWKNTYNDRGRTVLTRGGGANWPAIFYQ